MATRVLRIVMTLALATAVLALGSAPAHAQCASPITVADETEWNDAIACYNMLASGHLDVDFVAGVTLTGAATSIDNATDATLSVNGAGETLDANETARVVNIVDGNVTINNLTITGGKAVAFDTGGGVQVDVDAVVAVNDSFITNSSAISGGGIANLGQLTIERTTISDNSGNFGGGGIGNNGLLIVVDSIIENNDADVFSGGGVLNSNDLAGVGDATIRNTTISGNSSPIGAGIANTETISIENSTISGNTATTHGGGVHNTNNLTLLFSTVTDNTAPIGAGISSASGTFAVTNVSASIVGANGGAGVDVELEGAAAGDTFVSGSFNLLGSVSSDVVAFGDATSDLLGEDPLLGPLTAAGLTSIHPLLDGSMAIDRVAGAITIGTEPSEDQIGTARPQGDDPDIGAVESTSATPPLCDGVLVTINMKTGPSTGAGTVGNDVILGTNGNDTIDGGLGNDRICGGAGDDTIDGGDGSDRILGQSGEDTIDGGDDVDRIWGGADDDEIDGGDGNDVIRANAGNDAVDGGLGDDRIYGNADDDTLNGDDGDDRLFGNAGDDELNGGDGNDSLFGLDGVDTMNGNGDDDLLNGSSGADMMNGNAGTDTLRGGSDDDTLDGGGGSGDTVVGQGGDDALSGGTGTGDVCRGKSGTDTADATCEIINTVP